MFMYKLFNYVMEIFIYTAFCHNKNIYFHASHMVYHSGIKKLVLWYFLYKNIQVYYLLTSQVKENLLKHFCVNAIRLDILYRFSY